MPLQNYTTTIDVEKTLGEIMGMLARHGARKIETEYDAGTPTGITFTVISHGKEVRYRREAKADAVKRVLTRQKAGNRRAAIKTDADQAERTAWRNVKDLLTAQMTMLEYEQEEIEEMFLPKSIEDNGKTLYENVRERLMLEEHRDSIPVFFRRIGFDSLPSGPEEVKKQFRQLAKAVHPDEGGSDAAMQELNGYYEQAVRYFERGEK